MATQIVSAQTIPTLVRDAFRIAQQERPGPVPLELPEDVASDKAEAAIVSAHPVELRWHRTVAIERAAAMISAAKRPLVMLGAAASRPRLAEAVVACSCAVSAFPSSIRRWGRARVNCRLQPLYGHGGAVRTRLDSRGRRPGRSHHLDRPRYRGEAALHHDREGGRMWSISAQRRRPSNRCTSPKPR